MDKDNNRQRLVIAEYHLVCYNEEKVPFFSNRRITMKCLVVSPEKTVLDVETESVVLPLADGEYGILPGHTPLVARLGAGELRIKETGGKAAAYYVEGGFAEFLNDVVALLTMRIMPVNELNVREAEEKLQTAIEQPAGTPELVALKMERVAHRRARLRIAQKYAGR